jgi:hypothetical protein
MARSKEEIESLLAIDYRSNLNFKNLKLNQDKLSNCPRLSVIKRDIERWYAYYANEYITYLDYTYCANETRLPVLRTLHSNHTFFRVSFYTETQVAVIEGEYSYKYRLTESPRNCFKFSFNISRGTFPIDYLVFHKLEIPARTYQKRAYTANDPRYLVKSPTYEEWYKQIHQSLTNNAVTYQQHVPLRGESNEDLHAQFATGNYPYIKTSEQFEGHIRTFKKQKTVLYTEAILNEFKIQNELIKRAHTWIFDSAFDTTLNPFLHVSIYYFLISEWSERK